MQGILYLESAPKFAEAVPTATANTKAKTKHIRIRGSEKGTLKNFFIPFLNIKFKVNKRKAKDSTADKSAIGELISQRNGR